MAWNWTRIALRIQVNNSSFINDDKSEVNASISLSACDSSLSWEVILGMKLFGGLSVTFKKGKIHFAQKKLYNLLIKTVTTHDPGKVCQFFVVPSL